MLGPMVYGAAFWACDDDEAISKLGYDDSKGLTAEVRERMFKGIKEKEKDRIGFITVAIPAATISAKMLRAHPYSLNKCPGDAVSAWSSASLPRASTCPWCTWTRWVTLRSMRVG